MCVRVCGEIPRQQNLEEKHSRPPSVPHELPPPHTHTHSPTPHRWAHLPSPLFFFLSSSVLAVSLARSRSLSPRLSRPPPDLTQRSRREHSTACTDRAAAAGARRLCLNPPPPPPQYRSLALSPYLLGYYYFTTHSWLVGWIS